VDADGAEDNHAIAEQTARLRAVVALRALNNCTRLPRDCQGSCSPRPQALPLPGVWFDGGTVELTPACRSGVISVVDEYPSVQAVRRDEVTDDRPIVDRIAIPLASVRL
jgi:hypothetical protein